MTPMFFFFFVALLVFAVNNALEWWRNLHGLKKLQVLLRKGSPRNGWAEYTAGHHDGHIELGDKTVFFASWEAMDIAVEIVRQAGVPVSTMYMVDGGT